MQSTYGTLAEFAQDIEQLDAKKNDVIACNNSYRMVGDDSIEIDGEHGGVFPLSNNAASQVATYLDIPYKYWKKILDIPDLLTTNINALLQAKPEEKRFLRTWKDPEGNEENRMRALLSDSYRPYDHALYLSAAFPVLREFPNIEVKSYALTEARFYLQAVFPTLTAEIRPGETVAKGVTFRNSEIGRGYYDILDMVWEYICSNGMIGESILRKRHVGSKLDIDGEDVSVYADETIEADITALSLKIRDTLTAALSEAAFDQQLSVLKEAAEDDFSKRKSKQIVTNVTKKYSFLSEDDGEMIRDNLVGKGDFSRYGLMSAITALAHEIDDRDKQYDLERTGHKIITLNPSEWKVIKETKIKTKAA